MVWVSIGGCATALMANTDIPTATAVPMINCVMLLFCMIASQCNRLIQTIAIACSKHVTNVTTRGRFTISFDRLWAGSDFAELRIYLRCRGVTRPLR